MVTVMVAVILLVVTADSKPAPGSKVMHRERKESNRQRLSARRDPITRWDRQSRISHNKQRGYCRQRGDHGTRLLAAAGNQVLPRRTCLLSRSTRLRVDIEVTRSGNAAHGNSGETVTVKEKQSIDIEAMRTGEAKHGNSLFLSRLQNFVAGATKIKPRCARFFVGL